MSKTRLVTLTLALHAVFAVAVAVDARRNGRPAGKWAAATLVTGLVGVFAYVLSGDGGETPLDELVDQVDLE